MLPSHLEGAVGHRLHLPHADVGANGTASEEGRKCEPSVCGRR